MGLRVEPLGRQHRTLLKGFQNQHDSLVEYLQRYALRHLEKDLLARTYVAIDESPEGPRLAGYFSLSTVSVERSAAQKVPTLDRLPRFPIPGCCSRGSPWTNAPRDRGSGDSSSRKHWA